MRIAPIVCLCVCLMAIAAARVSAADAPPSASPVGISTVPSVAPMHPWQFLGSGSRADTYTAGGKEKPPQKIFTSTSWGFALFGRAKPAERFLDGWFGATNATAGIDFTTHLVGVAWAVDKPDCDCGWNLLTLAHDGGAVTATMRYSYSRPCWECGNTLEPSLDYEIFAVDRSWLRAPPRTVVVNEAPAEFAG